MPKTVISNIDKKQDDKNVANATKTSVNKTENVVKKNMSEEVGNVTKNIKNKVKAKPKLDLHDEVLVKNGYCGELNVLLPKSKYVITFSEFGDDDYIELAELKALRNSKPIFFERNWLIIEDDNVIDFLNVGKYYADYLTVEDIDELFELSVDEMIAKIQKLNQVTRDNIARRAVDMIKDGNIDSVKKIEALEEELGYNLTE